jgi:cyclic beta-1,2-glucan synthetase
VTAEGHPPTTENVAKTSALEADARILAESQSRLERATRLVTPYFEPSSVARALEHAQKHLASRFSGEASLPKAAEWFLDNYYLIRRVARQVADELPRGFVRHLPEVASGPSKGLLRVDALARAVVARTKIELDVAELRRFIENYQQVSPLTIAELWALPAVLRTCVLERLLQFLDELNIPIHTEGGPAAARVLALDAESLELEPGEGVERSIRTLRLLDALDWKSFFEKTNRVDAILRKDPAGVYQRMDFETCDSYRKVVEALAWGTGRTEEDVAELAIALAREQVSDARAGHVGHYLVGGGRSTLEARLGYRPAGLDRVRRVAMRWPTLFYLGSLALLTLVPLLLTGACLVRKGLPPLPIAIAMIVAFLPVSMVVGNFVQWTLAHLLPPRTLPKLDFIKGLPAEVRTVVVIPTLLGRAEDVEHMTRQLELHYLSNPDPQLQFALLTDDLDSKTMPESEQLLEAATARIVSLNARHGKGGSGPFHLLHREPRWNPSEERFMGWERKRGKLDEFNRLLRGDKGTSYTRHVGDPKTLEGVRFVITLDSDTELPMGTARRMIGLLAHPLNRAVFDEKTGRVTSGYTIVQPRMEISPSSARRTRFSRISAGDIGFDIYTHAVSEVYQDLFGSGIYVGKGIYDVEAFTHSIEGRVPENSLVSHDLFEGVHGRTALATDIILFESYPSNYAAYAMRMHRWVRGDWQLLPWLFPKVPSSDGHSLRNRLALIDRWKIVDNLRRSLSGPSLLLLLVLGWTWLPGSPLRWTLGALAVLVGPALPALARDARMRRFNLARLGLAIAFVAYEASVAIDAIARVVVRMTVTRKHLLEWTSAAHTAYGIESKSPRKLFWHTMPASAVLAVATAALVAWIRPPALAVAGPLLVIWSLAPEIARWVSQPVRFRAEPLGPADRRRLRLLARRTWRFFDAFVGPNDQWLPVDNYQEDPREQTAHRTSPTNIGLMLVATLSGYDFGYIGPSELSLRVRRAFESISRLSHYQGHLLNWYDTKNLQPLLPRYVSTVDSGNFAGCLLALKQGCKEVACAPVVRAAPWDGLADSIGLLEEAVGSLKDASARSLMSVIGQMQGAAAQAHDNLGDAYPTLRTLCEETSAELDRKLLEFLEAGAHRQEPDVLRALRMAIDRLHHRLQQMRLELDSLLPWLALKEEAAAQAVVLPTALRLDEIPDAARRLRTELSTWADAKRKRSELSPELEVSVNRLDEAFRSAETNATTLNVELTDLAARAEEEVRGMDFRLLYDGERKLFHIGYNVTADQIDGHYYDLLASEARLASYLAIVKRDVPESHWYALGRPMTSVGGAPALLSWGGTMFEYLMPGLLMRSQQGTLLAQTSELAVAAQIAHGAQNGEPWGVSESAYARLDSHQTYQYRSFGVPGLGFKRGLEDDRVIAPYASMLAVSLRPAAVVSNLDRLQSMGMLGPYGLFEALDLTPERLPEGRAFAVVRSYMAHHQGMLLIALGNYLNERDMIQRFHSNLLVQTGELLLNEHAPYTAPPEWPVADGVESASTLEASPAPRAAPPWEPHDRAHPQAFVLTNGRLTSLLTDSGGGGLLWQGLALTRYQPDATRDDDGIWIYLRDEHSGRVWLATSSEGRTTYAMHKAEFHRRDEGISVHVDVAVAPADDVEVRQITLHNETGRPRRLTVTSTGRPVLFDAKQAPSHPAFSSMFVESERMADLDGLLFARRPQSPQEEPAVLVHRLVREGGSVSFAGYETDRAAFFGRCRSPSQPLSLAVERGALRGRVGAVLDPIMSLMASVELKPRGSVTLAFVTTVSRSRSSAIELARRYGSMHAVRWAFRDADQESPRRLQRLDVDGGLMPAIQRLFSALLFAEPTLRVPSDGLPAARPCKRRLWGRGISGDDPILLVRVADTEAPLISEVLAAQRYLRLCGVRLDLVLLDEQPSGYMSEGSGTLLRLLVQSDAAEWLNQHGGVFLITADKLPEEERRHLEASARVVLNTRDGSLALRMGRPLETPPKLPRFEPTLADDPAERPRERLNATFDNGTGGFSEDGREYVLTIRPGKPTPAPWCNVLTNADFGCLVSESSLGSTWSLNSGENRITPWRNDPVFDTPSEALYLRDEETAALWSTTPLPAGRNGETLVRHGAGYTIYEKDSHGLEQEMTVFVPPDAALKVVRLRIRNTLGRHRRLTATYYAEWVLGTRREEQRPYIVSEFDRNHACLLATCNWNAEFGDRVAFLASRNKPHGFTTDRMEFIGRRGDYARPEALERWGLSGCLDPGVDPCAALQVHMELGPGEETETHFLLGEASSRAEAIALVTRFRDGDVVESALSGCHAFWDDVLGSVRVKTPEPAMDLMLNRWLLYQTVSARVFGRTAFYQSSGAFGYRDQLQDVMALFHGAPGRARAHILDAAAHQFVEGDVLHWWHPPSGRGVRTRCSDDMAWLPYVTTGYVAATGDVAILGEAVTYLTGEPLRPDEHDRYGQYEKGGSGTLLEHCKRALEHALTEGAHGLPLMGAGDWNDGMNRVGMEGRGESVWLGWFLCETMDRFAALCERLKDDVEASRWSGRAAALRAKIQACAWDGSWYLRAFHDDGSLLGSAKSRECRIDSIAQSWSVLALGKDESYLARARAAVRAADGQLVRETDRLVLLCWPPFDGTLHDPGYIRAYPPGIRENGGQYTHAATWLGWAHAALGEGEHATQIFRLLNPILRTRTTAESNRYRVEPYALAGDIYSCSPWVGRGGWTLYTGAAAWMWRLGVEAILGLRREDGHLRIDPCIPPEWKGFEAWVRVGEREVHVVVENPDRVATGVATMTLDDARLDSNLVRLDPSATGPHEVRVRLGTTAYFPARSDRSAV